MWKWIDSGTLPGQESMDLDKELLASLKDHPRHILRFYEWKKPTISYGHFIKPEEHLDLIEAEKLGIEIARRPTGGGVICHFTDFTFSVLIPKESPHYTTDTIANYCFINHQIRNALSSLTNKTLELLPTEENAEGAKKHFCMAKPTVLDVMCGSSKISGGAQRRTKEGFLHQGSISLSPPNWEDLYRLIANREVVDQMRLRSDYLEITDKEKIKKAIQKSFESLHTERDSKTNF